MSSEIVALSLTPSIAAAVCDRRILDESRRLAAVVERRYRFVPALVVFVM
jgi:hypothetical protein